MQVRTVVYDDGQRPRDQMNGVKGIVVADLVLADKDPRNAVSSQRLHWTEALSLGVLTAMSALVSILRASAIPTLTTSPIEFLILGAISNTIRFII